MKMPVFTAIAAVDQFNGIGKNGGLLFHDKNDMKDFVDYTMDTLVVMGRVTWESLPNKQLKGRTILVISSKPVPDDLPESIRWLHLSRKLPEGEALAQIVKACARIAAVCGLERVTVAGGGEVYELLAPVIETFRLHRFRQSDSEADTWLSDEMLKKYFTLSEYHNRNDLPFDQLTYKTVRPLMEGIEMSERVLGRYGRYAIPRESIGAVECRPKDSQGKDCVLVVTTIWSNRDFEVYRGPASLCALMMQIVTEWLNK